QLSGAGRHFQETIERQAALENHVHAFLRDGQAHRVAYVAHHLPSGIELGRDEIQAGGFPALLVLEGNVVRIRRNAQLQAPCRPPPARCIIRRAERRGLSSRNSSLNRNSRYSRSTRSLTNLPWAYPI